MRALPERPGVALFSYQPTSVKLLGEPIVPLAVMPTYWTLAFIPRLGIENLSGYVGGMTTIFLRKPGSVGEAAVRAGVARGVCDAARDSGVIDSDVTAALAGS